MPDLNKAYNVFLCYRGSTEYSFTTATEIYYNLEIENQKAGENKYVCFYAPKEYKELSYGGKPANFRTDIEKIMCDVKVVVILFSKDFFSRCLKNNALERDENDIVGEELIVIRNKFFNDGKRIIILNMSKDYDFKDTDGKERKAAEILGIADFYDAIKENVTLPYTNPYDFRVDEIIGKINQAFIGIEHNFTLAQHNDSYILKHMSDFLSSSSANIALSRIVDSLLDVFHDIPEAHIDITRLHDETKKCIDEICTTIKHFEILRIEWTKHLNEILSLKDNETIWAIEEKLTDYNKEIKKRIKKFALMSIYLSVGHYYTFSESQGVINILNAFKNTKCMSDSTIYIGECRSKCKEPFSDALTVYSEIDDRFKKIIIPDSSFLPLVIDRKIDKIILGACGLLLSGKTHGTMIKYINTVGSDEAILIAERYGLPIYVISETPKTLLHFDPREPGIYHITSALPKSINAKRAEKTCDAHINSDEIKYIETFRSPNMILISQDKIDIEKIVKYFIDDLNKDKRILKSNIDCLFTKKCESKAEYENEVTALSELNANAIPGIPRIESCKKSDWEINMQKFRGIRLFEFFVLLDALYADGFTKARTIKNRILQRCKIRQERVCAILNNIDLEKTAYPKSKIIDLVNVLVDCYNFVFANDYIDIERIRKRLNSELSSLYSEFCTMADRVFRDSTIKNMGLSIPELIGKDRLFDDTDFTNSKNSVRNIIDREPDEYWDKVNIFEFDFSTCMYTTTKYDDVVGLTMHERSFDKNVVCQIIDELPNNERRCFAISIIIRFLRFGGRKTIYRIINRDTHAIRFKFDKESFYFKNLRELVQYTSPQVIDDYPLLFNLFDKFSHFGESAPTYDVIRELHALDKDSPWGKKTQGESQNNSPWMGMVQMAINDIDNN